MPVLSWVLLIAVATVGLIVLGLVMAVSIVARAFSSGGRRPEDADEARLIQEIYQGMEKMEKRVEALETLLLEREGDEYHERA